MMLLVEWMFIKMTFGLYAYYCYCATVGKQAIKCGYQGAGCFFIASISVLLFFLSIAHAFLQAKSSLHSKQKYRLMKNLYKLLYKKYILKFHHEK